MATLIKWWKTRFHVGGCSYKTMTVLGSNLSDGRPSDTEDLVQDDNNSYNNGAHVNPCLVSPSCSDIEENHPEFQATDVKFEDFECDVQLEENESGEERKEFSFTFYDLDGGYGKITKDDVAGLVRSIYGAVNDFKVPQGGKKTIKVTLTVTPDKSTEEVENINNNNTTASNNNQQIPPSPMGNAMGGSAHSEQRSQKLRNNVNVTIQENLHKERSGRRGEKELLKDRFCHSSKPKFNSFRVPNSACRGCLNYSPEVFRDCGASPLRHRRKLRDRACSFHRPELINLIQANMEKNNVSPCCQHVHHQQNAHTVTSHQCSNQINDPMSLFRNEDFWKQKLTDITSSAQSANGCNNLHYPQRFFKVNDCPTHKISQGGNHHGCKKHGHHRSRSHDLSQNMFRYQLQTDFRDHLTTHPPVHPQNTHGQQCFNNVNDHEECVKIQHQGCILNHVPSPQNKNTNVVNSSSTHQLKHRNREVEHARSMAQVISWLQRENIGEVHKRFSSPKGRIHNPKNPQVESPPVVKKHEYHHLHTHHHYHHYAKETPIIV